MDPKLSQNVLGLEVLTAAVMKSTIFRDTTPCSPLDVNRRFGRIYSQVQGLRISRAVDQRKRRW